MILEAGLILEVKMIFGGLLSERFETSPYFEKHPFLG